MADPRTEPAGPKPDDVPGHVWVRVDNPDHGNCEANWYWELRPISTEESE